MDFQKFQFSLFNRKVSVSQTGKGKVSTPPFTTVTAPLNGLLAAASLFPQQAHFRSMSVASATARSTFPPNTCPYILGYFAFVCAIHTNYCHSPNHHLHVRPIRFITNITLNADQSPPLPVHVLHVRVAADSCCIAALFSPLITCTTTLAGSAKGSKKQARSQYWIILFSLNVKCFYSGCKVQGFTKVETFLCCCK